MTAPRRGIPLILKLPALVVVVVLVTAGAGSLAAILIGRNILRTQELEDNFTSAGTYARAIGSYLDIARSLLETTAHLPEMQNFFRAAREGTTGFRGRPADVRGLPSDILTWVLEHSSVFEYVMLVRADGSISLLKPNNLRANLSQRNLAFTGWYKRLMRTGRTVISDLRISVVTQRPTVVIGTPVADRGGQIVGILAGGLRLDELSKVGSGSADRGTPRQYGYVTDGRGLIIAHQAKPKYVREQTDFSAVPPVRAALAGRQGATQFVNPIEGEEQLGAYMPLPRLGWAVVNTVPARVAFEPVNALVRGTTLASIGLVALLGLVGWGVARQIVKPVGELTAGTEKIAAGDFTHRIGVRTGDEIGRLAREFNRMAATLAEKEGQLRQRADQLEAANKELEAFSYSVSHDLRAPLRAINGFSRILLEEHTPQLGPEAQRYLRLVRENVLRMGQLVDNLLAFSRLGRQPLKRQRVSPADLTRQCLEDLHTEREGRRVEIKMGDLPACEADPALLKQVLTNLLSNALKFTRRREVAVIEVGSRTADGELRNAELQAGQSEIRNPKSEIVYYVRDNGVGFDMQYTGKLFGVFQRLHAPEEYEGTGVGLAIVQRILHRHGGRIWAEAEAGRGATFFFTLEGGGPHD